MGKRINYKSNKTGWIGKNRMKKRNGWKRVAVPKRILSTLRTGGWSNMKGELKYFDTTAATYTADNVGYIIPLNAMATGTDANTRIGKQIYMKSVHVHGIVNNSGGATTPSFVRIMLVWDAQANNTLGVFNNDILVTSSSLSELNLNNRQRYTILRDMKMNIARETGGADAGRTIDMFVNLGNKKTTFSGTSNGIGNVATGALLLCVIGNIASGAPEATLSARVRFYDN